MFEEPFSLLQLLTSALVLLISASYIFIITSCHRYLPLENTPTNILFVTAHPDDETMFFAPTITSLAKQGHRLFLLCVSNGGFYGQGQTRVREIKNAVEYLGINQSDLTVLDYDSFKDGHAWDHLELREIILRHVKILRADVVITFDEAGVSGHTNHISIFEALQELYTRSELPTNTQVFCLDTVNVLRKYSWAWDAPLSLLRSPYRFFATPRTFFAALAAMRQHKSQLLWFRYLYVAFSRYMVINTYRRISPITRLPKPGRSRLHREESKTKGSRDLSF
ncbi:unnamed protein product, partial [Mesorhabditis spiculigera]